MTTEEILDHLVFKEGNEHPWYNESEKRFYVDQISDKFQYELECLGYKVFIESQEFID